MNGERSPFIDGTRDWNGAKVRTVKSSIAPQLNSFTDSNDATLATAIGVHVVQFRFLFCFDRWSM